MKIAITTVQIPFMQGGAELHAKGLKQAFIQAGHQAEIITMPFSDRRNKDISNHIAAARLMDLESSWGGKVDLCIGLRFPAYYMPHSNKVLWILHQHRGAYDLYGKEGFGMLATPENDKIRSAIMRADNAYIPEAKRIFTNSSNVSNRLMKYNHIPSKPLYHPCPGMGNFYEGEFDDYILMPSRVNVTKRQALALEALQYCKEKVKIYFVGRGDVEEVTQAFKQKIIDFRVQDKVKYFEYVPEEEKLALYANASGVLFIPIDEDYGYITLEGMSAGKPIITATDSGGPLEFVEDGQNGFVVEPTPQKIAEALDELWRNRALARQMGRNGKNKIQEMGISWENVVKELTKP